MNKNIYHQVPKCSYSYEHVLALGLGDICSYSYEHVLALGLSDICSYSYEHVLALGLGDICSYSYKNIYHQDPKPGRVHMNKNMYH
jgi:hypothetical protein